MLISKIGEFGLINRFKKSIKLDSSVIKGPGDDCAVLEFSKDKYLLYTCDMLVEGVDYLPKTEPYLIGRKAMAVSVSDIAACAGIPRYCLVSLGLPPKTSVTFIGQLFKGMRAIADKYRINIVGGDLSRAKRLVLDVSMLGVVEKKYLVLRSGAKIGDFILVTGKLGGSIKGKHLKFVPRLDEARYLVRNFKVNSMIDISDGLTQDLGHILRESHAGAVIYERLIPLSRQARSLEEALYGGEDFELLFTLPSAQAQRLLKDKKGIFRPIGLVVEKEYGLTLLDKTGKLSKVKTGGFKHF